jgi:hypothetical protein
MLVMATVLSSAIAAGLTQVGSGRYELLNGHSAINELAVSPAASYPETCPSK